MFPQDPENYLWIYRKYNYIKRDTLLSKFTLNRIIDSFVYVLIPLSIKERTTLHTFDSFRTFSSNLLTFTHPW